MAMPGVSLATISSQHFRLISRSRPPWMMQNRFCRSGYLCASMHRSSQRMERSMASCIRARSGDVVAMTSSSCIMISEPIEFCNDIECSGVRSLLHVNGESVDSSSTRIAAYTGVPSCGLRNLTPSSVTVASFNNETIWKLRVKSTIRHEANVRWKNSHPPLSVSMFLSQPCNRCAPPTTSNTSCPGFRPK